ncbi:MAG: M48 family peptidase [Planctomycetota bacterium]|nr:MAG: M48 family peptidase [Planctomycetota bacterium]
MNPYAAVILAALVGEYALRLCADVLNVRALRPELPAGFERAYDATTYRRSQEYTRVRTRFGLIAATVELAALLLFWRAGGFPWLDELVRSLGLASVPTGVLFIGLVLGLGWLLGLPFQLWGTFVIEERFGFNRTNARTFVADTLKGLLLALVLGGPLLAAILAFFERTGAAAWLWCWAATTAFLLFVQYIAPTWLMPLFNRFTPIEEGELKAAILDYGRSVGFPLAGIFVIDGSRRSTKANAFFTGFGPRKRIALFDTLIEQQSTQELLGVVAHEVGHYKRHHVLQGLVLAIANAGLVFWLMSLFISRPGLFEAFGVAGTPVYAGLVFFALLYKPVELLLAMFLQALSRKHEFEADRFAARTTGRPESLASALIKLSAESLTNLTPHPFYVFLHHSHPPLARRVGALVADSWPTPTPARTEPASAPNSGSGAP